MDLSEILSTKNVPEYKRDCVCEYGSLPNGTPCPICEMGKAKAERSNSARQSARDSAKADVAKKIDLVIPSAYRAVSNVEQFSSWPAAVKGNEESVASARLFVSGKLKKLVISGGFGTGKTQLAACIAQEMMADGIGCAFHQFDDLMYQVTLEYRSGESGSIIEDCKSAGLLVIDDLGNLEATKGQTDHTMEKLNLVLNHRTSWEVPTVITSNLSEAQLLTAYGERVHRRISQSAAFVEMKGSRLG